MAIEITSPAFGAGQSIPVRYTRDGENVSPPLRWAQLPDGTQDLAVIVDDPDAPGPQPLVHWVAYRVEPSNAGIHEGVSRNARRNDDTVHAQGRNSFGKIGYDGPAPPPGHGAHHYRFHVYALDKPIVASGKLGKENLIATMAGHILDEGELVGVYERTVPVVEAPEPGAGHGGRASTMSEHGLDELFEVTHELRHLTNEEKQEGLVSARRRKYGHRKVELSRHFEWLLWFYVDEPHRAAWHEYVHHGDRPPEPAAERPLSFKGRDEGGATLEVHLSDGHEQIMVDGTVERGHAYPLDSGSVRRLGERVFREAFDAPDAALAALRDFLAGPGGPPPWPGAPPPWRWARTLFLEGIIDTTFSLTERGRRFWRRRGERLSQPGRTAGLR